VSVVSPIDIVDASTLLVRQTENAWRCYLVSANRVVARCWLSTDFNSDALGLEKLLVRRCFRRATGKTNEPDVWLDRLLRLTVELIKILAQPVLAIVPHRRGDVRIILQRLGFSLRFFIRQKDYHMMWWPEDD
jgi:hypothetical protein